MRMSFHRKRGRSAALVLAIFTVCGFVFVAANQSSRGTDLRPAGGDISSVLTDRSRVVEQRRNEVAALQREIDELTAQVDDSRLDDAREELAKLEPITGFTAVSGSGMRITLEDAPRSVDDAGINPNFLVVHEEDLQAFVNAMWAGGAQAVTMQGKRLIATTGIKCVGNTVLLDGVPYSPPYVIEAVGSPSRLQAALDDSVGVSTYMQWVDSYRLGFESEVLTEVEAPAYQGVVDFRFAEVAG